MFGGTISSLWTKVSINLQRRKQARLRIWHNFCDETPLQGFLIYRNSHFRYERAIWMLLVTAAIVVTLRDTVNTVVQFMDEELLSKVTMQLNESIILPNPTICLELSLQQRSVDFWNETEIREFLDINKDKIRYLYGPLAAKLDSATKNDTEHVLQYLGNEPDVSIPLLDVIQRALGYAQSADWDISIKTVNTIEMNILGPNVPNSAAQVLQFLTENKLNFAEVMKTSAMYLCKLAGLQVVGFVDIDWCGRRQYVTSLDLGSICFRTHQLPHVFNFTRTKAGSNANVTVLANPLLPKWITVALVLVNFNRRATCGIDENSIFAKFMEHVTADVSDITSIQYRPTAKSPCDTADSWVDCEEICISEQIKKRCGCILLSSLHLYCADRTCLESMCLNESHFGGNVNYSISLKCIAEAASESAVCSDKCLKPCLLLSLQFVKTMDPSENRFRRSEDTQLRLLVSRQTYLSSTETLAMDPQTFISNLGGNLGLYIGGTVLALIHLLTSVVRLIVSLLVAKDDTELDTVESTELKQSIPGKAAEIESPQAIWLALQEDSKQLKREISSLRRDVSILYAERRNVNSYS